MLNHENNEINLNNENEYGTDDLEELYDDDKVDYGVDIEIREAPEDEIRKEKWKVYHYGRLASSENVMLTKTYNLLKCQILEDKLKKYSHTLTQEEKQEIMEMWLENEYYFIQSLRNAPDDFDYKKSIYLCKNIIVDSLKKSGLYDKCLSGKLNIDWALNNDAFTYAVCYNTLYDYKNNKFILCDDFTYNYRASDIQEDIKYRLGEYNREEFLSASEEESSKKISDKIQELPFVGVVYAALSEYLLEQSCENGVFQCVSKGFNDDTYVTLKGKNKLLDSETMPTFIDDFKQYILDKKIEKNLSEHITMPEEIMMSDNKRGIGHGRLLYHGVEFDYSCHLGTIIIKKPQDVELLLCPLENTNNEQDEDSLNM